MNDLVWKDDADSPLSLAGVSFVSRQQQPVRKLPGFSKPNHRVPVDHDQKSQAFVGRLGIRLVQEDLDNTFQTLRSGFGFKRRDLESTDTEEGFGTITTPNFLYSSSVYQCPNDPSQAIWQRDISQITEPAIFFDASHAFQQTFDTVEFTPPGKIDLVKLIDHIEDLESQNLQADYDRGITYCHILLHNLVPQVRVTQDALQIVHPEPTPLPTLLVSVQAVQTNLLRFAELT